MKTNRLIALLLASGLLTVGACKDDFLDVPPANALGDAQLQTKAGVEGLLVGAYAALNGVFGNRFEGPNHWVTGSILGGDANKGTDGGDYSTINPVQRFEHDAQGHRQARHAPGPGGLKSRQAIELPGVVANREGFQERLRERVAHGVLLRDGGCVICEGGQLL